MLLFLIKGCSRKKTQIAKLYQTEFKRGTLEDKYFKMRAATEIIFNYLRDKKLEDLATLFRQTYTGQ